MSANSSSEGIMPQLPNPFTPMAFIPPDLAFQVMFSVYILVGSSVLLLWDCLNTLSDDWKLLSRYRFTLPTFVYFLSRITSLAYLVGGMVFASKHPALLATSELALTMSPSLASHLFRSIIIRDPAAPIGNCKPAGKIISWLYPFAIPSTVLLFFFRVRAMYHGNHLIIAFFSFLWLAVLGGALTEPFGVTAANIGTTKYCINAEMKDYVGLAGFIPFVNDTLIFAAITWRLMRASYSQHTMKNDLNTAFFGKHLPAFTKGLLKDGQAYYLSTVIINIVYTATFYNTSMPLVYRIALTMPNIALMNVMACRVYRRTKFGIYRESTTTGNSNSLPVSSIHFGSEGSGSRDRKFGSEDPVFCPQIDAGTTMTRNEEGTMTEISSLRFMSGDKENEVKSLSHDAGSLA